MHLVIRVLFKEQLALLIFRFHENEIISDLYSTGQILLTFPG